MNIKVCPQIIKGKIDHIPSKSYSHRYLIIASLLNSTSTIYNCSMCDDVIATMNYLEKTGCNFKINNDMLTITTTKKLADEIISIDNSGSSFRMMVFILFELYGIKRFTISKVLFERLVATDFDSYFSYTNYEFNECVKLELISKKDITIFDVSKTTQYLSGYLMLAIKQNLNVNTNNKELPTYVKMTIKALEYAGIRFDITYNDLFINIKTKNDNVSSKIDVTIEDDVSLLSTFILASSVNKEIIIPNLQNTLQPESNFLNDLNNEIIDVSDYPDIAMNLMAYFALTNKKCKFIGLEKLKFKESNRISSALYVFDKVNIHYEYMNNELIIYPSKNIQTATLDTFNDHRVLFLIILISIITNAKFDINNAQCYKKSYPSFINQLEKIGFKIIF